MLQQFHNKQFDQVRLEWQYWSWWFWMHHKDTL